MNKTIHWLALAALLGACDTPLDTDPTDAVPADEALQSARDVALAVNGIYDALQQTSLYDRELTAFPEMYADNVDFTGTFTSDGEVANRNIRPANTAIRNMWRDSYEGINRANTVLSALPSIDDLSDEERDHFRGEALFLRALNYLNLVRYFGGVPVVTEPSETVTEGSKLARNTAEQVYTQIEADLGEAATLLPASGSPARATGGAANALLARAYLEQAKWALARDKATEVIQSNKDTLATNYADLFAGSTNSESIFEVEYSITDGNNQAFWYFPDDLGGRWGFTPSDDLYAAYEPGDERRDASISVYDGGLYGIKYHRVASGDDNVYVLRLAELYLIRAEANARLNEPASVVQDDIDVVRNRAGLSDLLLLAPTQDELIDAILQERRVEFAMEGHRFFDLRRTGRAEQLLEIDATLLLFPIPQAELDVNDNLEQNPGY